MGLSTRKGNGGFLGIDARRFITSSGIISERKARIERLGGNLAPPPPNPLFFENFSSGDFSNWTVKNTSTSRQWIVGSGAQIENANGDAQTVPSGSTYAAFVSTSNTGKNIYNNNTNVHIYIDFDIPDITTSLTLTFNWMCGAENASGIDDWDFGYIGFADTSFTPTAGSEYGLTNGSNYERIIGTNLTGGSAPDNLNTNSGKFNCYNASSRSPSNATPNSRLGWISDNITIDSTEITNGSLWTVGTTRRLIFSFTSDGSVQPAPSWTITNIKLEYNTE